MDLLKRFLGSVARGVAAEAAKVSVEAVAKARETEEGRDALQNLVVGAGIIHVAGAKTPRESLDRLDEVVRRARWVRGDK